MDKTIYEMDEHLELQGNFATTKVKMGQQRGKAGVGRDKTLCSQLLIFIRQALH